jgi:adenine-specific DNA methylase
VLDPPYYDFIAYDELSEFHRAWLGDPSLAGEPLLPTGDNGVESFGLKLAECLRGALARLRPGRPLAFTYHSADPVAWKSIGVALDDARLRVTAAWPVRSDGHMGHHSHPGNCEWDIVFVCRPTADTVPTQPPSTVESWIAESAPFSVGPADRANFELALLIAGPRFGSICRERT